LSDVIQVIAEEKEAKVASVPLPIQTPQVLESLKVQPIKTPGLVKNGILPHSLNKYKELESFMKNRQNEYDAVFNNSQNQELKNYKFDLQKAINFLLNSLLDDDNDNKRNFEDKIKTILRILNGETCVITSILTINPKKHPKGKFIFRIII
jgi:hypothetical protein